MAWKYDNRCKRRNCPNKVSRGKFCKLHHAQRVFNQAKQEAHVSFSNQSMRVPCPGKPHIQLIRGWWRVSPVPKGDYLNPHWQKAHAWIYYANEALHAPKSLRG